MDLNNGKESGCCKSAACSEQSSAASPRNKALALISRKDINVRIQKLFEGTELGYQGTKRSSHWILWMTLLFFVLGLLWAYLGTIDEVTVAQGKVVPSKQMQIIQNLEGGIVKEILVARGDIVEKGQVLGYLDRTRFLSEYNENKQKEIALQLKVARLGAEVSNQPFVVPAALSNADASLIASENLLYKTRHHEIQSLVSRRGLLAREVEMTRPLTRDGAASQVDLLHLQQSVDEIDGNILNYRRMALDDLTKAKADLDALHQEILASADRLNRTTLRSPVKGIVNQINIHTEGGVVNAGQDLIEIVPMDDSLLVEAKVRPSDIGFIRQNEEATVKITAYDYSIYGGLKGKVEHISADTITDPKGNSFYEVWVRTSQNFIQPKDITRPKLFIIPGMTASVNILTGHKSVLDYILKPILKAKQNALHER